METQQDNFSYETYKIKMMTSGVVIFASGILMAFVGFLESDLPGLILACIGGIMYVHFLKNGTKRPVAITIGALLFVFWAVLLAFTNGLLAVLGLVIILVGVKIYFRLQGVETNQIYIVR